MTPLTTRTLATALAGASLAFAVFAPTVGAAPQDFRSPDTRDAAIQSVQQSGAAQDLRAPDTRDAASNYAPVYVAEPTPVSAPSSDGFDWASAAIGAAAIGGLILVLLAGVGTRRHVQHRPVLH